MNVHTPPHDRDAERAVLGGIIRDPDVLPDVQAVLGSDAFYLDAHRRLFVALGELTATGAPVDLVTLFDHLRKSKQLEDAGGKDALVELWEAVPTGANAVHYAHMVRDAATRRGLIHAANEILRDAYAPTMPASEQVAAAERTLYALAGMHAAEAARPVRDVVRDVLTDLDARIASGGGLAGLSTGYPDLDALLGGMRPGELIVVAARPSLGKTALSLNIAERVAGSGSPVLFVSMEMRAAELGERLLAMGSGVAMHRFSRPRELRPPDIAALFEAGGTVGACPLFVDDASDQTAARVAAGARRAVRRDGIELVVVDYLGLMRPENPKDNRTQQVGTLAQRMKQMARQVGVPVILLSQLNRESDAQNRRPRLSDLRDSGEIEQHADRVILLHREPDLSPDDPVWPVDLIVAKNRNGPTGDVRLAYRRPVLRFENAALGGFPR